MSSRVLLAILILFFLHTISSCRATGKDEIVNAVNQLFREKRQTFLQLVDTFQKIKSHSKNWKLENLPKSGVQFYSFTPFENYGITWERYKNLYYNNVDTSTSPCFVADFEIPSNFEEQVKQIFVQAVRIIKDTANTTNRIDFTFNSDKFPPITRTVTLSYFPQTMPDSLSHPENISVDTWAYAINYHWLLRSLGNDQNGIQHRFAAMALRGLAAF